MSEEKPESLKDIADAVDALVRSDPKNMTIFRNRCKRFYEALKEYVGEYSKEIIANNETPGEKLSGGLTRKLKEKFKDDPDIFEYLFFPASLYNTKIAHINAVLGMEDYSTSYNKRLSILADYVRLAVLHDMSLESPRTELINHNNNSIWPKTEWWVGELWGRMQKGWFTPSVIDDLNRSYLRVKEDLFGQQRGSKTNKRNPQDPSTDEKLANNVCNHSPDYRKITWYGKPYTFKKNQAIAIKLLWQAHEDPQKVGVHESEIGKALDTTSALS